MTAQLECQARRQRIKSCSSPFLEQFYFMHTQHFTNLTVTLCVYTFIYTQVHPRPHTYTDSTVYTCVYTCTVDQAATQNALAGTITETSA